MSQDRKTVGQGLLTTDPCTPRMQLSLKRQELMLQRMKVVNLMHSKAIPK